MYCIEAILRAPEYSHMFTGNVTEHTTEWTARLEYFMIEDAIPETKLEKAEYAEEYRNAESVDSENEPEDAFDDVDTAGEESV
jgi:hypothetical protein